MKSLYSFYTLERPAWFSTSGPGKGIQHDKQHANLILKPGAVIRVRLVEPYQTPLLEVDLLNDDSMTELTIRASTQWQYRTIVHTSVVFIRTPYRNQGEENVSIGLEIEVEGDYTPLQVYIHGETDEHVFLNTWNATGAPYVLYEAPYASLLIPLINRDYVNRLSSNKGLDAIGDFYDKVFTFFNNLAGLSFDSDTPTDRNARNRYFMKPDKSGPGAAYYGQYWTAESSPSIAEFWLDISATNWGCLHEIAHGYQADYNSTVYTGEVWNNIYAHFYQKAELGSEIYDKGWLYEGRAEALHTAIKTHIQNRVPVTSWDLREHLYFFVTLIESADISTFATLNKRWRALIADAVPRNDIQWMDVFLETYQKYGNIDLSYFMQLCGAQVKSQIMSIGKAYNSAPLAAPAYQLISEANLPSVIGNLGLSGPVSLITTAQLHTQDQLDLYTRLSIDMDEDAFNANAGHTLMFRDGALPHQLCNVSAPSFTLESFPVGIYSIAHPHLDYVRYRFPLTDYAVIKESTATDLPLTYAISQNSSCCSQQIVLQGYIHTTFCLISVDYRINTLTVAVIDRSPHSLLPNQTYAQVTVKDVEGKILFLEMIPGEKATLKNWSCPIDDVHTIDVFHHDSAERIFVEPSQGITAPGAVMHTFQVTPQGLINPALNNDPGITALAQMDMAADAIRSRPHQLLYKDLPLRNAISLAVSTFSPEEQINLKERYRDLNPTMDSSNVQNFQATALRWEFLGLADQVIASIALDLAAGSLELNITGTQVHESFTEVYLAIWVSDPTGKVVFCDELRGDVTAVPTTFSCPFTPNTMINVLHLEGASRSILTNTLSGERISTQRINTLYRSVANDTISLY